MVWLPLEGFRRWPQERWNSVEVWWWQCPESDPQSSHRELRSATPPPAAAGITFTVTPMKKTPGTPSFLTPGKVRIAHSTRYSISQS
jgi:hypothetical protein